MSLTYHPRSVMPIATLALTCALAGILLSGAIVRPGEHLVCAIRDRFGNTPTADLPAVPAP